MRWLEITYPFFAQVNFATSADPEYEGGTCYVPESHENPFAVILMGGAVEDYEKLKRTRPDAIKSMARLLGTSAEHLDGATIQAFIFFHEAGHLFDYFANFLEDNALSYEEATDLWIMNSDHELASLPIPELSPSDLRFEMKKHGGFEEWRRLDSEFDARCVRIGAKSAEELVHIQEMAYRALPKEAYADEFAAKALKDFFTVKN